MKSVIRFKYHDGYITNRMKLTRLIWQSCNILVGLAIDELNFELAVRWTAWVAMYRLWT